MRFLLFSQRPNGSKCFQNARCIFPSTTNLKKTISKHQRFQRFEKLGKVSKKLVLITFQLSRGYKLSFSLFPRLWWEEYLSNSLREESPRNSSPLESSRSRGTTEIQARKNCVFDIFSWLDCKTLRFSAGIIHGSTTIFVPPKVLQKQQGSTKSPLG